ncbi:MAG: ThuA domain-containing protein, partial [Xanthomonadales bacterium]|nr:ThuA domain-containing protein [Xanthomonadales bacterium]NIX11929.1 ThuA domain-containing protein [Xanthomonadales bacterium]
HRSHNPDLMDEAVQAYLGETGLFEVTVARTPAQGEDMSPFSPDFSAFDVVILNYDGDEWPAATKQAFEGYVRAGGGMVSVHSSDNAFPDWEAYLDMTGLGGWGGRDEKWGPAVRWRNDGVELFHGPGEAFHPKPHEFPVTVRDPDHPVMQELPREWLHARDELYSNLRGPARNLHVLATGFADPSMERASGEHEPVLFTVRYGEGRIFHSTLGHIGRKATGMPESVRCNGFIATLQRGAEWAATGHVTQPLPGGFPGAGSTSTRP